MADRRIRLLNDYFFSRNDVAASLMPWGRPSPVPIMEDLEKLLVGHLRGGIADVMRVGSYAANQDSMVRWVCLDFDGGNHSRGSSHARELADAAVARAYSCDIPAYMECSGSGKGWHVWAFFSDAVPAAHARELGGILRADAPAEVFPKQDKVVKLGNFVWLPWWRKSASRGGNIFHRKLNGTLRPYSPERFDRITASDVADLIKRFGKPREAVVHVPRPELTASEQEVWSALESVDPDCTYPVWIRIGMALHDWNEERGLRLWDEWSRSGTKYKEGETQWKWGTFHQGGGITLRSLFWTACR